MKTMKVVSVSKERLQDFDVIKVVWASSTGRVVAMSRTNDLNQYSVGDLYQGKTHYGPNSNIRFFMPLYKAGA